MRQSGLVIMSRHDVGSIGLQQSTSPRLAAKAHPGREDSREHEIIRCISANSHQLVPESRRSCVIGTCCWDGITPLGRMVILNDIPFRDQKGLIIEYHLTKVAYKRITLVIHPAQLKWITI